MWLGRQVGENWKEGGWTWWWREASGVCWRLTKNKWEAESTEESSSCSVKVISQVREHFNSMFRKIFQVVRTFILSLGRVNSINTGSWRQFWHGGNIKSVRLHIWWSGEATAGTTNLWNSMFLLPFTVFLISCCTVKNRDTVSHHPLVTQERQHTTLIIN